MIWRILLPLLFLVSLATPAKAIYIAETKTPMRMCQIKDIKISCAMLIAIKNQVDSDLLKEMVLEKKNVVDKGI